jgi:hypothetical protein
MTSPLSYFKDRNIPEFPKKISLENFIKTFFPGEDIETFFIGFDYFNGYLHTEDRSYIVSLECFSDQKSGSFKIESIQFDSISSNGRSVTGTTSLCVSTEIFLKSKNSIEDCVIDTSDDMLTNLGVTTLGRLLNIFTQIVVKNSTNAPNAALFIKKIELKGC